MLYGYTQTGCNLHVFENQVMKVTGFENTHTIRSQMNRRAVACHSMESHTKALYWKKNGGKINGNSQVWTWDVETVFECAAKDIPLPPRPYILWTIEELKEELRGRKLKVSGTKDTLIERLEKNNKDEEES